MLSQNIQISRVSFYNIIISIFRMKLYGYFLTPSTLGLLGILQNIVSLSSGLSNFGYSTSIVGFSKEKIQRQFVSIVLFNVMLSLILIVFIYVINSEMRDYSFVILLCIAGFAASQTLHGIVLNLFGGVEVTTDLLKINIISLLITCLALVFVEQNNLIIFSLILLQFTFSLFYFLLKLFLKNFRVNMAVELFLVLKEAIRNNIYLVFSSLCPLLILLLVRTINNEIYGLQNTGNLQAVLMVSSALSPIVLTPITSQFYQRIAKSYKKNILHKQLKFQSLFAPLILLAAWFLYYFQGVLFNEQYALHLNVIVLVAMAEILKMYTLIFSYIRIAKAKYKSLICIDYGTLIMALPLMYLLHHEVNTIAVLLPVYYLLHLVLNLSVK